MYQHGWPVFVFWRDKEDIGLRFDQQAAFRQLDRQEAKSGRPGDQPSNFRSGQTSWPGAKQDAVAVSC